MNNRIPDLTIEHGDDGSFLLEQDGGSGNVDRIELHPTQVRYLAELAGLLPKSGNRCHPERLESGNGYHPPAPTLARRLRVLLERIRELDGRLWAVPVYPPGSANDDPDLWYSDATLAIAEEFCADLSVASLHGEEMKPAAAICQPLTDAPPAAPSQMELEA